jgi:nucleolin
VEVKAATKKIADPAAEAESSDIDLSDSSQEEQQASQPKKEAPVAGKREKPEEAAKPKKVEPKKEVKKEAKKEVKKATPAPVKPKAPVKEVKKVEEKKKPAPAAAAKPAPKKLAEEEEEGVELIKVPAKPKVEVKAKPAKKEGEEESDIELSSEHEEEVKPKKAAPAPKEEEMAEENLAEEAGKEEAPEAVEEPKEEEEQSKAVEEEKQVEAPKEEAQVEEAKAEPDASGEENVELFIGNLPFQADDNAVYEFFGVYGEVVNVKLLQRDGRPMGKGFVQFKNGADAAKAKAANGMDFMGRAIAVRFANDPAPAFQERQSSPRRPAGNGNTIFVGGLSYQSTNETVAEFFGQCGNISGVRIATDQDGNPRGFAHVEFDTPEAVQAALQMTGQQLDGRSIRVDMAGAKGEKPAGGRFGGDRGGSRGGFRGAPRGGAGGFRGGRGGMPPSRNKGTMQGYSGKKTKLE